MTFSFLEDKTDKKTAREGASTPYPYHFALVTVYYAHFSVCYRHLVAKTTQKHFFQVEFGSWPNSTINED